MFPYVEEVLMINPNFFDSSAEIVFTVPLEDGQMLFPDIEYIVKRMMVLVLIFQLRLTLQF